MNFRQNRARHKCEKPTKDVSIYCSLEDLYNGTTKKMRISNNYTDKLTNITKPQTQIIEINIKPGWKEGTSLTYNLIDYIVKFTIKQKEHKFYKRIDNDIIWECKLSKQQAEKGVNITIPLINGEIVNMTTKEELIYSGKRKVIHNRGMPIKNTANFGNFIIDFKII